MNSLARLVTRLGRIDMQIGQIRYQLFLFFIKHRNDIIFLTCKLIDDESSVMCHQQKRHLKSAAVVNAI
jgi:hypothetical protein